MDALVQAFLRILVLRDGPQSIPASYTLMWLVLLLHFATGFVLTVITQGFGFSVLSALVGTLMLVAFVHGLLLLFRKHERYLQTVTALGACEVILGLMMLPIPVLGVQYQDSAGAELGGLLAILLLVVLGWSVAVTAHIFRHALSVSTGLGFLYSIAYFIITSVIYDLMGSAGATG